MKKAFKLSDDTYDALKWTALIALPLLSTAYRALATVWNLPFGEEIPQTITVIGAFLGGLLGVSSIQYNRLNDVTEDGGGDG